MLAFLYSTVQRRPPSNLRATRIQSLERCALLWGITYALLNLQCLDELSLKMINLLFSHARQATCILKGCC